MKALELSPIVLALILGALGVLYVDSCTSQRRAEEQRIRADSLAAEAAAERARANGWVAVFGKATEGLTQQIQEADSQLARLARDYEASRIEVRSWMRVALAAQDSGSSEGAVHPVDTAHLSDSATGTIDDGILRMEWTYLFPPRSLLEYTYGVRIPGEIITAETGDRRLLVTARSPDPRVTLQLSRVIYELPELPQCGFGWKEAIGGAVLGFLGGRASN